MGRARLGVERLAVAAQCHEQRHECEHREAKDGGAQRLGTALEQRIRERLAAMALQVAFVISILYVPALVWLVVEAVWPVITVLLRNHA